MTSVSLSIIHRSGLPDARLSCSVLQCPAVFKNLLQAPVFQSTCQEGVGTEGYVCSAGASRPASWFTILDISNIDFRIKYLSWHFSFIWCSYHQAGTSEPRASLIDGPDLISDRGQRLTEQNHGTLQQGSPAADFLPRPHTGAGFECLWVNSNLFTTVS